MKHVIVIETVDIPHGIIHQTLQNVLLRAIEIGCEDECIAHFVHAKFNVESAIAAVHEMYNVTPWDPDPSE